MQRVGFRLNPNNTKQLFSFGQLVRVDDEDYVIKYEGAALRRHKRDVVLTEPVLIGHPCISCHTVLEHRATEALYALRDVLGWSTPKQCSSCRKDTTSA